MRPLVVGSPRSGFALLCSVLSELLPMSPLKLGLRQRLLRLAVTHLQWSISEAIEQAFAECGIVSDLIYNGNFRTIAGGPKWLKPDEPGRACIRKYVGARGMGDFTLIVAHPAPVLETDDIVHSHSHPRLWTETPHYDAFHKFASVRNPIGIVNSSLFSLNALTSEYIQRFMRPEDDTDEMRQRLALYKFSDLQFFEGIVRHYKGYFEEFLPVADRYTIMRWEDLISAPGPTIQKLAASAGLDVDEDHAAQIWARLDHVNLTGAHKHNFRRGKGIVGDWRSWMTNRHLDILRTSGLEAVLERFDYDPVSPLDETAYTPFQREVAALIARGEVYDQKEDPDLFGFAFNKSNLDSSAFNFKRYAWRSHTCVERSAFSDEAIVMKVWDAAESAAEDLNSIFAAILDGLYDSHAHALERTDAIAAAAAPLAKRMPKAGEAFREGARALIARAFENSEGDKPAVDPNTPPRLIRAWRGYNIVAHLGRFSALPHAAGAVDLRITEPESIEGALVSDTYDNLYRSLQKLEKA